MARFFFHLVDSIDVIRDPEGTEMPEKSVAAAALFHALDCMAGDVKSGRLDFRYRIEVQNEIGKVVHVLPFADALEIVPAGDEGPRPGNSLSR